MDVQQQNDVVLNSSFKVPKIDWKRITLKDLIIHERIAKRTMKGFYGTSCAVYLVSLKSFPEIQFAMKVLYRYDPQLQESRCIREGLDKEVLISQALKEGNGYLMKNFTTILHSFVDTVTEEFKDWDQIEAQNRTLFLIMPLADLETLSQEIRKRQQQQQQNNNNNNQINIIKQGYPYFNETEVIFIIGSLLGIVDELNNQHKIVHRDIKPDNIFLYTSQNNESQFKFTVSLGDFGEAWNAKQDDCKDLQMPYSTSNLNKGGAALYLAPEIKEAKPGRTSVLNYGKNDVYAVGMVALQLMCDEEEWNTITSNSGWCGQATEKMRQHYSKELVEVAMSLVGEYSTRPLGLEARTRLAETQREIEEHYQLGTNYFYERLQVEQNREEGVEWFKKSAERGYVSAQNNLALCYYNGEGVEKNIEKAVELWKKSAEQGNAVAQQSLGTCYYHGEGVEKNLDKAVEWFKKSAEQGQAVAQQGLGTCYYYGEGVEKNAEKAVEWWKKSAEQGNAVAQQSLGTCYYNGEGVEKNIDKAVEWFKKSAEQGDAVAQLNLGTCYY